MEKRIMSFEDYKKRRKNIADTYNKIVEKNTEQKTDYTDDRMYNYTKDKAGNAFALLRFLPAKDNGIPIVSKFTHGFKSKNGFWYIENCPTTIKGKCPACEENNRLWTSGIDENKKIASDRKRKKRFFVNVYIIKDPNNPDAEGKVFLWSFGPKVYEKITQKLKPDDLAIAAGEKQVDVFDLFDGANFKLQVKQVGDYPNYDACSFAEPSPLFDDENKLKEVYEKIYPLAEFEDKKTFKPYEELKKRFDEVMSSTVREKGAKKDKPEPEEKEDTDGEKKDGEISDGGSIDDYFEKM
jgi:hypothetical protein